MTLQVIANVAKTFSADEEEIIKNIINNNEKYKFLFNYYTFRQVR